MNQSACRRGWRRALTGAFLLVSMLFLHAAVVFPALHQAWHGDEHACDQPDCVVLVMAQGGVLHDEVSEYVRPWVATPLPSVALPVTSLRGVEDCPLLPGRAPPV